MMTTINPAFFRSSSWTTVAVTMLYIAVFTLTSVPSTRAEKLYPCNFIDTVNITGDFHSDSNESYVYDGNIVPRYLITEYDFVMRQNDRISVPLHFRACVCLLKPCVRFCCSRGYIYDTKSKSCFLATDSLNVTDTSMAVKFENGSTTTVETFKNFSVQIGAPCDGMRFVAKDNKLIKWQLLPNGTISRKSYTSSKSYCLTPHKNANLTWEWQALGCPAEKLRFILGPLEWTYAICLMLTAGCYVIILLMYLLCKDVQSTTYGCAIQGHAICMILGYGLLAHLTLTDPAHMTKDSCLFQARYILFFLLLAQCILSFVSFSTYMNFLGVMLTKFLFWLSFSPILGLNIGWTIYVSFATYNQKLVFGGDPCWFDPRNWSIMVYFYTPMLISFAISGFFIILTLIQLNEIKETETTNKLLAAIEENRFKSFSKYYCYNFCAWLAFIAVFIVNYYYHEKTHISYGACLLVALQGWGVLYALMLKNRQIQNWLRKYQDDP